MKTEKDPMITLNIFIQSLLIVIAVYSNVNVNVFLFVAVVSFFNSTVLAWVCGYHFTGMYFKALLSGSSLVHGHPNASVAYQLVQPDKAEFT